MVWSMLTDIGVTVLELVSTAISVKMRQTNVIRRRVSIMQHVLTSLRFVDSVHFTCTDTVPSLTDFKRHAKVLIMPQK